MRSAAAAVAIGQELVAELGDAEPERPRKVRRQWRILITEVGQALAKERDQPYTLVFDDSLRGDLARLTVLRRLRASHPTAPADLLSELIEEVLL